MQDLDPRYQMVERPWAPAKRPATIGETWDASRTLAAVDNTDANFARQINWLASPTAEVNRARRREGLPDIQNPAIGNRLQRRDPRQHLIVGGEWEHVRVGTDAALRDFYAEVRRIRKARPDFLKEIGDDPAKFMAGAIEDEKTRRAAARETMERSGGVLNAITGFAGGLSKAMEDPANIAGVLVPGAGGRTIPMIIAREVGANFLFDLALQPFAARNRELIGEELTMPEALANASLAGIGAGAISGGAIGAGRLLGPVWEGSKAKLYDILPPDLQAKWRDASVLPESAIVEIYDRVAENGRTPPDVRAAIEVMRRDSEIKATSPFAPGGGEAHDDLLRQTIDAIMDGAPPVRAAADVRARLSGGTSMSTGVTAAPGRVSTAVPELTGFMRAVRGAESSGNDLAKARTSSAFGRYQFTGGTWVPLYIKRFGRGGLSDDAILAKRADGAIQDTLMRDLTMVNARTLQRAGHDATGANLYLAHFAGPADALKVLNAPPGRPLRGLIRDDSIAANRFLSDMTAGDLRAYAARKVGRDAGAPVRVPDVIEEEGVSFADLDADAARLAAREAALDAEDAAVRSARAEPEPPAPVRATVADDAVDDGLLGPIFVAPRGRPGFQIEDPHGDGHYLSSVFRDESGAPQANLRFPVTPEARELTPGVSVYVAPELRRQGIATRLYDNLRAAGHDIDAISGTDDLTPAGAEFVNARRARQGTDRGFSAAPAARDADVRDDAAWMPIDDYDRVAPMLAGEAMPLGLFDADDPIWDAIDRVELDRAMAEADPSPAPALNGYDDPVGADAEAATDSLLHDLRATIAGDPSTRLRLDEEGDELSGADVLADLDADRAVIAAIKGCM